MTNKKPYGTVLMKADAILAALYEANRPLSLVQLAEKAMLTKSTTLKILETLENLGYVTRSKSQRTYLIGFPLMRFGLNPLSRENLIALVAFELETLQKKFDETVHLGMFKDYSVETVAKYESSRPVVCISSLIGESKELYSSGMGKAVLAELKDADVLMYLNSHVLEKKTPKTLSDTKKILMELEDIRTNGYALDKEENEAGVFCVGAPIQYPKLQQPMGAFSISIPISRRTKEYEEALIEAVLRTKWNIQQLFNEKRMDS